MYIVTWTRKSWNLKYPEYPYAHRCLEVFSIAAFLLTVIGMIWINVTLAVGLKTTVVTLIITGSVALAYLVADFISGLVHFLCDNLGDENTPIVGQSFIKPFREHHDNPTEMVNHDFIETNGNTFLTCFIGLFITFWIVLGQEGSGWLFFSNFMLMLGIFISLTNQFHKWAHQREVPGWVGVLQKTGIILSPRHHGIHHRPPYEKYYCITSGILNPLLNRINFFNWLYNLLT